MRIGVIGVNHRLAGIKIREQLARGCQDLFLGPFLSLQGVCGVLLSTCNRTEVYFSSPDILTAHESIMEALRVKMELCLEGRLYSYFLEDCFLHLSRVVTGLDSAILGETEIQGQVKQAYQKASEAGSLPTVLHFLFQKSLKIGKKIRSELALDQPRLHLEHEVARARKEFVAQMGEGRGLVVGASDINRRVLRYLRDQGVGGLHLCNRSESSGREMANEIGIPFVPWSHLQDWMDYSWVMYGTKSPEHLLVPGQLPDRLSGSRLIIDLCVPRNVDPEVREHPDVELINIDELNMRLSMRRSHLQDLAITAEQLVSEKVQHNVEIFREKEKARQRWALLEA